MGRMLHHCCLYDLPNVAEGKCYLIRACHARRSVPEHQQRPGVRAFRSVWPFMFACGHDHINQTWIWIHLEWTTSIKRHVCIQSHGQHWRSWPSPIHVKYRRPKGWAQAVPDKCLGWFVVDDTTTHVLPKQVCSIIPTDIAHGHDVLSLKEGERVISKSIGANMQHSCSNNTLSCARQQCLHWVRIYKTQKEHVYDVVKVFMSICLGVANETSAKSECPNGCPNGHRQSRISTSVAKSMNSSEQLRSTNNVVDGNFTQLRVKCVSILT